MYTDTAKGGKQDALVDSLRDQAAHLREVTETRDWELETRAEKIHRRDVNHRASGGGACSG